MNILLQLLEIITLRREPQDLQYDEMAAAFYFVASVGLGYITHIIAAVYSQPLMYSVVLNCAQAGTLYGVLSLKGHKNRFVQTCTAVFGVTVLLGLARLIFAHIPLLGILVLAVVGWALYLLVIIVRAALDCSTINALLVVIVMEFVSVVVLLLVFPQFLVEFQQLLEVARSNNN
ncbi:MAG: hypothetical protein HKN50_12160 [Gammaproteobacteria bacterium]|nr:hypothetical protein [Gammaproteobacteria bacterium]